MKSCCPIFLSFLLLLFSCASGSKEEPPNEEVYYPISGFIREQVKYLDSVPLAILHYHTEGNRTDSSILEKKDFEKVALDFMKHDPGDPGHRKKLEENSFADATLRTITLAYTAVDKDFPLHKADVLLDQESMRLRSIYLEKLFRNGDTSRVQKMIWTPFKNCQVVTLTRVEGQPEKVEIDRYVWDNLP